MLRIIGLCMLSVSFAAGGFVIGEHIKKRHLDTLYLLSLIKHLKREICYGRNTLTVCYSLYKDGRNQRCTKLLAERSFQNALSLLHLPSSQKERLLLFFTLLGSEDLQTEESRCENTILFLEEEERELRRTLKDRIKIAQTVGICIGGSLLLLLL
ncbi:MAG: hypothetical protein J6M12_01755 [Clostridia bacterium]|nr:hypothetical protein [Clostridia bacterium]